MRASDFWQTAGLIGMIVSSVILCVILVSRAAPWP
jgi:hypothetical protein